MRGYPSFFKEENQILRSRLEQLERRQTMPSKPKTLGNGNKRRQPGESVRYVNMTEAKRPRLAVNSHSFDSKEYERKAGHRIDGG